MEKFITAVLLFLLTGYFGSAQEQDLLNGLDNQSRRKEVVTNAFKSSRVINGHSMEFIGKGVLDFRILHRFGRANDGASEWFGLDQASMRMGLDYGLGKSLTVGIGRSTYKKEADGFLKLRLLSQKTYGTPFSVVVVTGMSVYTYKNTDPLHEVTFSSRAGYYYQSIIGRKFSRKFSLQLSPTVVHRNIVQAGDVNDIYAIGIGSRFKLSKRTALVADYFPVLNRPASSDTRNSMSLGFDIETGGHVFQLHFSNSTGMNERAFITDTHDSWGKGEIRFGFNLSRVFTVKKTAKT